MNNPPRDAELLKKLIAAGEQGLNGALLDQLPLPWHIAGESGEGYEISPQLLKAAQVALLLHQPLLLTGDPGVGKTRFAAALASRLRLDLQRIHVKTTTSGRDLLYSFDDVARFRDAAILKSDASGETGAKPLASYVRFNGLGRAIMRSAGPQRLVSPKGFSMREIAGDKHAGRSDIPLGELFPVEFEGIEGPSHSLVLIDELDKASRDAPNDLLVEIEEMHFDILELGLTIRADHEHWPIIIITSNSERSFPDPFLRRCVFHHLELPNEKLPMIIARRLPGLPQDSALVDSAIERFRTIREEKGLERRRGRPSSSRLSLCYCN